MKINLHILKEDLSDWEWEGILPDEPYIMKCGYPLICTDCPTQLEEDILYIIKGDLLPMELPAMNGCPSLACFGKPPETWLSGCCNLIYTLRQTDVSQLANLIMAQLCHYGEWEQQLQQALDRHAPLRELATLSTDIFKNSICVQGAAFNLIFSVLPELEQTTPLYRYYKKAFSGIENETLGTEDINDLITDTEYRKAAEATVPTIYSGVKYGFRTLYYNLYVNDVAVARLYFDEIIAPFTGKDFALIQVLGHYIKKGLTDRNVYSYDRPFDLEGILNELLSHHLVLEKRILSVLQGYQWQVDDSYICLVLKLKTDDSESALEPLALGMAVMMQNDCYTISRNRIVFICNLTRRQQTRGQLLTAILPFLRDNLFAAGISTTYHDFKNLYYYYKQAGTALALGEETDPGRWYFRYEDYQIPHILNKCTQATIPEVMVPDGLKALISHDARKGTEYTRLLRIYLENERNIAKTIRAMYMHRNTFLYRIQRIHEIMGMNLDDPETRLILCLAFRFMETQTSFKL